MGKYTSVFDLLYDASKALENEESAWSRYDQAAKEANLLRHDLAVLLESIPGHQVSYGGRFFVLRADGGVDLIEPPPNYTTMELPNSLKAQPEPTPDPAAKLDAAMAEDADAAQCWAKATPTDSLKGSVLHYAEPFEPAVDPSDFDAVREPKPLSGGAPEADATMREQAANFELPDIPVIPPITRRCDLSAIDRIREEYRNETA